MLGWLAEASGCPGQAPQCPAPRESGADLALAGASGCLVGVLGPKLGAGTLMPWAGGLPSASPSQAEPDPPLPPAGRWLGGWGSRERPSPAGDMGLHMSKCKSKLSHLSVRWLILIVEFISSILFWIFKTLGSANFNHGHGAPNSDVWGRPGVSRTWKSFVSVLVKMVLYVNPEPCFWV